MSWQYDLVLECVNVIYYCETFSSGFCFDSSSRLLRKNFMPLIVHQCNYIMNVYCYVVLQFIGNSVGLACSQQIHKHTKNEGKFVIFWEMPTFLYKITTFHPCISKIVFCVHLNKCSSAKSLAKFSHLKHWKIEHRQKFQGNRFLITENNPRLLLIKSVRCLWLGNSGSDS